ncbi:MAG: HAMP domain-containing protein [Nitrospirae bacterium]|nr:MAG: HAMP domain-containing protein [Nitrospirota bacterium]
MTSRIRRWFLNRSLNGKLVLVFSLPFLFLLLVTALILEDFDRFERAAARTMRSIHIRNQAVGYMDLLLAMQNGFRGFLITGDRQFLTPYTESKEDIDLAGLEFARLVQYSPSQAQRDRVAKVQSLARQLIQEKELVLARMEAGESNAGMVYIKSGRGRELADTILSLLREIQTESSLIIKARQAATDSERTQLLNAIVGGTLLTLLLTGLGVVVVARSVTKPMSSLAKAALEIGESRYATFQDTGRQDEVGALSRSMEEMQRRLVPAERLAALTRIATSIAHDLRTPLVGVERGLQGLQYAAGDRLTPDAQRLLGDLHTGARLAVGIVQDILDLYRQAYGDLPLSYARFTLDTVVREAIDLMKTEVVDRQLSVAVDAPPVSISADQRRLFRVLVNLLDNAIKNSPAGGGIWVRVAVQGEGPDRRAVVAVEDEGRGLDPAALETLFEPNRPASTPTRGGTGLGLYLCRLIIAAHQGTITAQNRPGGGARFTFDIPVEVHHVDQASDRGRPAPV